MQINIDKKSGIFLSIREKANKMLSENAGVIASFSRALAEGLSAQQSDADFDKVLGVTVQEIYEASVK